MTADDAKPDDIDCGAVLRELYTFLDGELTAEKATRIQQHAGGCVGCGEVVEFHYQLKITIAEKCREQVPPRLSQRIMQCLGELRAPPPGGIPRP